MSKQRIYLDNNATTAVAPEVSNAIMEELNAPPSNPSSVHFFGQMAKARLSKARSSIASHLKVKPTEIVFTSGGTESMNLLIQGFCTKEPGHIITSNIEHSCVYQTLKKLEEKGWEVTCLPAGSFGAVPPSQIEEAIKPNTRLIVLSSANSETGVKHEIDSISKIAEKGKIGFIVDAVASFGKEALVIPDGVSGMGFSSHKIHGPKGVGFAFVRSHAAIKPLMFGGEQEFTLRSGTENLPGIVGLAAAVELLQDQESITSGMNKLRDYFEKELEERASPIIINGEGPRAPNVSNVSFPGVDGETLLIQLDLHGVAASHGSACSSGSLEPSRILLNMGLAKSRAASSVRFSLSRYTTKEEIDPAIAIIASLVKQIRNLS